MSFAQTYEDFLFASREEIVQFHLVPVALRKHFPSGSILLILTVLIVGAGDYVCLVPSLLVTQKMPPRHRAALRNVNRMPDHKHDQFEPPLRTS